MSWDAVQDPELLRDIPKMEHIISAVIQSVRVPVTVKTRLGWDAQSIKIVEIAKMVENVVAAAHEFITRQGHRHIKVKLITIPKVKSAVGFSRLLPTVHSILHKKSFAHSRNGMRRNNDRAGSNRESMDFSTNKAHSMQTNTILWAISGNDFMCCLSTFYPFKETECKGEKTGVMEFRKAFIAAAEGLYGGSVEGWSGYDAFSRPAAGNRAVTPYA